jgi:hypothetical protein
MPSDPNCPYCNGAGVVSGQVDDVHFVFECPCSGGIEESVQWLLGLGEKNLPTTT